MIEEPTPQSQDEAAEPTPGPDRLGVLRVGSVRIALPGSYCSGIVELGRPTPLPRSPAHILGITLLHGKIVPILDPSGALGIQHSGDFSFGLVVEAGGMTGVVAADEIVAFEAMDPEGDEVVLVDVPALLETLKLRPSELTPSSGA